MARNLGRNGWLGIWAGISAFILILVQARALSTVDEAGLQLVVALRQVTPPELMAWVFRLGYAQVDAVIAIAWAGLIFATRRSMMAALPPLILFAVIGTQAGLRLIIDQPAPGSAYEIQRSFAAQPAGYALDQGDAGARDTFIAVTTPPGASPKNRGSFPSGHAARSLFLAFVGIGRLRMLRMRQASLVRWMLSGALIVLAGLVGYSALFYGYHWPSDVLGGYTLALAFYQLASRFHGEKLQVFPGISRRSSPN